MGKTSIDESIALGALQNLKSFRADATMKQATYAYIASQMLSKSKKEEMKTRSETF